MRFDKLNELIPYATGPKNYILTMQPYNAITLAMPGRHQKDTETSGGDFVVMVDDEEMGWVSHKFTHTDIFLDFENKAFKLNEGAQDLMRSYTKVIEGADPAKFDYEQGEFPGIHPQTLLFAVQCLAVAEHRRYARFESQFGGRYLPFRFAAGIVEGLWTARDAIDRQRRGRPGVEWLEKDYGIPVLTKVLMQ